MATDGGGTRGLARIPRGVWTLGFVSMLMDVSSEMIHALLPVYLVSVLGASMVAVGFIEGLAESTSLIVKMMSGALSDMIGKRKVLAAAGYGLAAVTKPVFPLAPSLGWIVAARFVDRVGKGIRGAPRDALITDITPDGLRGASFGLRQSLDTIGAVVGPLLAILLMAASGDNFTLVFWVAAIPAFASFALVSLFVSEPERSAADGGMKRVLSMADASRLPAALWAVVGFASVFTLARFSEAFLVLKAREVGLALAWVPVVMVVMNVAYAIAAYPAGALSDRIGRTGILLPGIVLLVVADVVLALAATVPAMLAGVVLWGLHMALTQGVLASMVADTAPEDLRGTAFGVFNLACGVAMLLASVLAGAIWDAFGARATFLAGAGITALALGWYWVLWRFRDAVSDG